MNTTQRVAILLGLLGVTASAQPMPTRGGALKRAEYRNYAAQTFYVDGALGSDTGACATAGTGACASLGRVVGLLPKNLHYQVQVNLAATTADAAPITFENFVFGDTGSITVTGTLTTVPAGAGLVTGTVTSFTALSATAPATATVTGAGWTVNGLRGMQWSIGGVSYVIAENTATTVTFAAGSDPASMTGGTFAIQKGTLITQPLRFRAMPSSTDTGSVILSNVELVASANPTYEGCIEVNNVSGLYMTNVGVRCATQKGVNINSPALPSNGGSWGYLLEAYVGASLYSYNQTGGAWVLGGVINNYTMVQDGYLNASITAYAWMAMRGVTMFESTGANLSLIVDNANGMNIYSSNVMNGGRTTLGNALIKNATGGGITMQGQVELVYASASLSFSNVTPTQFYINGTAYSASDIAAIPVDANGYHTLFDPSWGTRLHAY